MKTNVNSEVRVGNDDFPLPKSKMPSCWDDDMKMNYLFTKFRSHTVNPQEYETKMKFWTTIVEDWCVHHDRPVFTLNELNKVFKRNGRTPECLPTVIENMFRNGDIVTKSSFVYIPPQQTWTGWTMDLLVKKPTYWAFTKVKDSLLKNTPIMENDVLVHVSACKTLGTNLLNKHKDQVLELSELAALLELQDLEQVLVLVHGLRREGKAAIKEGSPTLVKLGGGEISEVDVGTHVLHKNEQTLARHLEELEAEKQETVEETKTYLAKNMRQAAKSCLKKKHVLDRCIDKRMSALDNVRVLLSRLHEAKTDAKVLEAYKVGVSALKNTLKTSGLTEDSAADTMLEVQEVLDIHNEIETALSQPIQPEDDLESELAELLRESGKAVKPVKEPKSHDEELEERLKALSNIGFPELPKSPPSFAKVPAAEPAL